MKTVRLIYIIAIVLVLALQVSAYPLQKSGGSAVLLQMDGIPEADPAGVRSPLGFDIARNCYITLFSLSPAGEPQRYLCRDYMLNWLNGELNLILHKAAFSNGRKITAEDCKFTLERVINERPDLRAAFKSIRGVDEYISGAADEITGLSIVSETELLVRLDSADSAPDLLKALSNPATGILSKASYDVVGRKYFNSPVTSGPFGITRVGDGVILTQQQNYPFKRPWLDSITIKQGYGENAYLEFSVGAAELLEVPSEYYRHYKTDPGFVGHRAEGGVMLEYALLLDPATRPLDESTVRRAIMMAVDNSGLSDVTLGGAAFDVYSLPPDIARVDYRGRFEAAKALLANYGDLGQDPVVLGYPSDDHRAALLADRIATNLTALGINLTTKPIEHFGRPGVKVSAGILLMPAPLTPGIECNASSVIGLANRWGFGGSALNGKASVNASADGCYLPLLRPLRLIVASDDFNPPYIGLWGEIDLAGFSLG